MLVFDASSWNMNWGVIYKDGKVTVHLSGPDIIIFKSCWHMLLLCCSPFLWNAILDVVIIAWFPRFHSYIVSVGITDTLAHHFNNIRGSIDSDHQAAELLINGLGFLSGMVQILSKRCVATHVVISVLKEEFRLLCSGFYKTLSRSPTRAQNISENLAIFSEDTIAQYWTRGLRNCIKTNVFKESNKKKERKKAKVSCETPVVQKFLCHWCVPLP